MDLNIIDNYYKNSNVAKELLKADIEIDRISGIGHINNTNTQVKASSSRKRSREEFREDDTSKFFQVVIKEWDHAALVPIFKIYADTRFNILLAKVLQFDKETDYTSILQNVTKFRDILQHADKHYYLEHYQNVYSLLSETMFHHLLVSKDMILAFSRGASRIISHFE